MQNIYRQITNVVNNEIKIVLPDYINTEKVEVIIIPILQNENKVKEESEIESYYGITNIGIDKIESKLNELRNEWER